MLYKLSSGGSHPFSEVVGTLQRIEGGADGPVTYVVARRDGSTQVVPVSDIVALKVLPGPRRD